MGKKRKHQSDYEDIEVLKRQLSKARNKGDFKEVGNILNLIGVAYREKKEFDDALEYHEEEVEITKKHSPNDKIALGVAFRAKAEVYIEMNEEENALPLVKDYLRLSIEANDLVEEQRAHVTLGRVYLGISNKYAEDETKKFIKKKALEKAEREFRRARDLLNQKEVQSRQSEVSLMDMKCGVFINLAIVLELKGQLEESKQFFLKAVELGRKHSLYENVYRSCMNLCDFYTKLDNYRDACNAADEAAKAGKALGNRAMEIDARILEAKMFFFLDDVNSGVKLLKKLRKQLKTQTDDFLAKQNMEDELDPLLTAGVRIRRTQDALFYTETNEYDKRQKYSECLGDSYVKVGNFLLAIRFYQEAIEHAEKNKAGRTEMAKLYFSLAETYRDRKDYFNAINCLKKEIGFHKDNPAEAFKTQTIIIDSMEKAKMNVEEVIDAHEMALKLADDCGCPKRRIVALKNKANYFKLIGLSDESGEILRKVKTLQELYNLPADCEPDSQEQEYDTEDSIDLDNLTSEDDQDLSDEEQQKSAANTKKRKFKLNEKGETPLHIASQKGDIKTVRRLLREGHNVNARDFSGWTPLHEACNFGAVEVVEALLENGANVNDPGGEFCDRITPLHDAATNGQTDVMQALLQYNPNILAKNSQGNFVLDELIAWKSRATSEDGPLDDDRLEKYKEMKVELKKRMAKAGYVYTKKDSIRAHRKKKERSLSPKFTVMRGRKGDPIPVKTIIDDFDPDNAGAAVDLYSSTILRLRGKNDKSRKNFSGKVDENSEHGVSDSEHLKDTRRKRSTSPKKALVGGLQNIPVPIIDDGLDSENEDIDLFHSRIHSEPQHNFKSIKSRNTKAVRKARSRSRSRSPNEYTISDVSSKSDEEEFRNVKKCTTKRNRIIDITKEDDLLERDNYIGLNISEILLSDTEEKPSFSAAKSKRKRGAEDDSEDNINDIQQADNNHKRIGNDTTNIRAKVHIGNKILLVPISQENVSNTIDWLREECVKRYFESSGMKPVLSLATSDGALLTGSDIIYVVLNGPEVELFANISTMDLPRLPDRFKAVTSKTPGLKSEYEEGILLAMDICQSSNILNLSDFSLQMQLGQTVFQALKYQYELKELILSECVLQDEGIKQFAEILPTLESLSSLDLNCNGITSEGLGCLVRSMKCERKTSAQKSASRLTSLNLSFNPLGNSAGSNLVDLLIELPDLKFLHIADCDFNFRLLAETQILDVFKRLKLQELDLSYNIWGKAGLELIQNSATVGRLNCNSCLPNDESEKS